MSHSEPKTRRDRRFLLRLVRSRDSAIHGISPDVERDVALERIAAAVSGRDEPPDGGDERASSELSKLADCRDEVAVSGR